MSVEVALRSRLKADAAVAAIVATRIDWSVRPQRSAMPAIVLQVVSDVRPQTFKENTGTRETRVQIDCYALTRAQAISLRDAVINAISSGGTFFSVSFSRTFINNVIDRGENTDTGFVHRELIDASIWHSA